MDKKNLAKDGRPQCQSKSAKSFNIRLEFKGFLFRRPDKPLNPETIGKKNIFPFTFEIEIDNQSLMENLRRAYSYRLEYYITGFTQFSRRHPCLVVYLNSLYNIGLSCL